MNKIVKEFVSTEPRNYKFTIGHVFASSLTGFVAGAIFASIVWGLIVFYLTAK